MKRKDRPFIFMLTFLKKKITIFYKWQLKISKTVVIWCPGYFLFEDPERSGYSLFEYRSPRGTHLTLSGCPECSGHSNKECPERTGSSNKEYPVCTRTSSNNLFADFQLLIVKNCDFFPQKCQHKNERPILPLCSGISYKPIGNTVHPWHNIEHALWIF